MRLAARIALVTLIASAPANADGPAKSRAALVPGARNTAVTQANIHETICVAGWTKSIRPPASYTNKLKVRQLRTFGLPGSSRDYEEDHLIPLELGGDPASPSNLWPEPRSGSSGSKQKDRLERIMHRLVCSGQLSLAEGQRELTQDWTAAYQRLVAQRRHPAALYPPARTWSAKADARSFRNCREARAAGVAPIRRGQPGYSIALDRDRDGFACE